MTLALVLSVLAIVAAAVYGASLAVDWLKANGRRYATQLTASVGATAIAIATFSPVGRVMAQSELTLDFDLTPFFDALNLYLPVFIGIFAIVGGIAGAMALAKFVINAVVNAFRGGNL